MAASALAQVEPNTEFQIKSVDLEFQDTPGLSGGYQKRGSNKAGKWLEVEVTFDWQPRDREVKYIDDVTINYFVLLSNKNRENPQGTMLSGSVEHVDVAPGRGLKSVMFVAPRSMERLFDGRVPGTARQAVEGVGVTISSGGQEVAQYSTAGKGAWWTELEQVGDRLLTKVQTPFVHLAWDYHEPVNPPAKN
jgi:hypothetical protein